MANEAYFSKTRCWAKAENVLLNLCCQTLSHLKNVALRLLLVARTHKDDAVRIGECDLVPK